MENRKNFNLYIAITSIIILMFLGGGIYSKISIKAAASFNKTKDNKVSDKDFKIYDNKNIYKDDTEDVKDLYVTVVANTKGTLADINKYKFKGDADRAIKAEVEVRLEVGKASVDSKNIEANAKMKARGHSSSDSIQKSFTIELFNKADTFNGQKILNLNKQPFDLTRIRQKICLDYFKMLPDVFGLRSQFCHVFIKDMASGSNKYVDYGLFTDVENIDMEYIKSHGLGERGNLYKAQDFEFDLYEDVIKNVKDPTYDKVAFEKRLGIRGIEDHSKLIEMLKAVNDTSNNINDVIAKYFDRDNYITWLALNIVSGNTDTSSQNFFIYSPITSKKWFFIPWDYDGTMGIENQPGSTTFFAPWQTEGVCQYWGVTLHRRFFKNPQNIKDLTKKIEEFSKIMTEDRTDEMVKKYYKLTNGFVKSTPDNAHLPSSLTNYKLEIDRLPKVFQDNIRNYYLELKNPMPVFMGEAIKESDGYILGWEDSYDFEDNDITYNVILSTDVDFKNVITKKKNIKDNRINVGQLAKGVYYWKLEIYNSKGGHEVGFDMYIDSSMKRYFGVKQILVK